MSDKMKSLADYIAPETLNSLATPANFRLGEEIAKNKGVELIESSPFLVVAKVKPVGGLRRKVELRATEKGLICKCTCNRGKLFCKHCVAAALAVWERL